MGLKANDFAEKITVFKVSLLPNGAWNNVNEMWYRNFIKTEGKLQKEHNWAIIEKPEELTVKNLQDLVNITYSLQTFEAYSENQNFQSIINAASASIPSTARKDDDVNHRQTSEAEFYHQTY